MSRLILLTCLLTPYSLAFPETYTNKMLFLDYTLNILFFLDVILSFFSAY